MAKKGEINPYRFPRKKTFSATFFHALLQKRITRGLAVKTKIAAERICSGLEFLNAHPETTRAEYGDRDPRAWLIFFKDVQPLDEESISLETIARETFPDLPEADLQRALQYVVTEETTHLALVEVVQHIAKISGFLDEKRAPQAILTAFHELLETLAARVEREVAGRKKAEWGAKLDAIAPYEPDYNGNPDFEETKHSPDTEHR